MGKVVFDISLSLDGFITAANQRPEEPMGQGGEKLHEWALGEDEGGRQILEAGAAELGAVITGRKNYDDSAPWWGADGPTGPLRLPVFVVTHRAPVDAPQGGVYRFVTGGIERALQEAQAAAGAKVVTVMGGADIGQQYIRAGLVDEISIHLAPVLYGNGTPMFEHLGDHHIQLECLEAVETAAATHLRYRVMK